MRSALLLRFVGRQTGLRLETSAGVATMRTNNEMTGITIVRGVARLTDKRQVSSRQQVHNPFTKGCIDGLKTRPELIASVLAQIVLLRGGQRFA